jgi:hypothetical protein
VKDCTKMLAKYIIEVIVWFALLPLKIAVFLIFTLGIYIYKIIELEGSIKDANLWMNDTYGPLLKRGMERQLDEEIEFIKH